MRKFYYVCPRCGRGYKRYIPRRKTKCAFCATVWKTRGARGTRSEFSWTATLAALALFALLAVGVLRFNWQTFLGIAPPSEPVVEEPENPFDELDEEAEAPLDATESVEVEETNAE